MKRNRSLTTVALALLLVLLLGVTGFAAEVPGETDNKTATIYVEKDGGILLTVDEEGNILSAEYVNELDEKDEAAEEDSEDEEERAPLDDLVDESLIEGLKTLLDAEETEGYVIVIDSEDEEYLAGLEKLLEDEFSELLNPEPTEEMESTHPLAHRFAMALELGITPGKMNLLEKLGNGYGDDDEFDYEEWAEKSVKEIMAAVNAERRAARQAVEEDGEVDSEMDMEVLSQSLQNETTKGNPGNINEGRGNSGNKGNSKGKLPGNASSGKPSRGNNK